jgi:hypothetical protein
LLHQNFAVFIKSSTKIMTRSKLFLAATGGLLAIAAVSAAKAHHAFQTRRSGFYSKGFGEGCNFASTAVVGYVQTTGNAYSGNVKTQPGGIGATYTVYSKFHLSSPCVGYPLKTAVNQS